MYPRLVLPNLGMLNSPQIVLITVNEESRKQDISFLSSFYLAFLSSALLLLRVRVL